MPVLGNPENGNGLEDLQRNCHLANILSTFTWWKIKLGSFAEDAPSQGSPFAPSSPSAQACPQDSHSSGSVEIFRHVCLRLVLQQTCSLIAMAAARMATLTCWADHAAGDHVCKTTATLLHMTTSIGCAPSSSKPRVVEAVRAVVHANKEVDQRSVRINTIWPVFLCDKCAWNYESLPQAGSFLMIRGAYWRFVGPRRKL